MNTFGVLGLSCGTPAASGPRTCVWPRTQYKRCRSVPIASSHLDFRFPLCPQRRTFAESSPMRLLYRKRVLLSRVISLAVLLSDVSISYFPVRWSRPRIESLHSCRMPFAIRLFDYLVAHCSPVACFSVRSFLVQARPSQVASWCWCSQRFGCFTTRYKFFASASSLARIFLSSDERDTGLRRWSINCLNL